MTPTITPPTDNLYKFIALFGLVIFLFSLYKSGDVFDKVTNYQTELEDLKNNIKKSFSFHTMEYQVADSMSVNVAPAMVKQLSDDLTNILEEIENSTLDVNDKLDHETSVRKLLVNNESLRIKIIEYISTLILGVILMILGFTLWYFKDQRLKDKILESELQKALQNVNSKP